MLPFACDLLGADGASEAVSNVDGQGTNGSLARFIVGEGAAATFPLDEVRDHFYKTVTH